MPYIQSLFEKWKKIPLNPIDSSGIYPNCYIAFLSIKGFGLLVESAAKNPSNYRLVRRAYQKIHYLKRSLKEGQVTLFPDAIVCTAPLYMPDAFFTLVTALAEVHLSMIHLHVACAGAITTGEVFHQKDKIEGPALQKVFAMIKKYKKYAFILIDNPTVDYALTSMDYNLHSFEKKRILSEYLSKDIAGYRYVDPVKAVHNAHLHHDGLLKIQPAPIVAITA